MALFVAKFLESTFAESDRGVSVHDTVSTRVDPERESPPIITASVCRSSRITRQAFNRKLSRMYMKNTQRQMRENIELARTAMENFVLQPPAKVKQDQRSFELLKLAEPDYDFEPSTMDLDQYVSASLSKLKSVLDDIEAEAKAKEEEDVRVKMEIESKVALFFNQEKLDKIESDLHRVCDLVSINFESEDVRKGEFLNGVLRGLKLTRIRESVDDETIVRYLMETRKILTQFEDSQLSESNCYRILTARFRIVMKSFCDRLVSQLDDAQKRRDAYMILKNFSNQKFEIESKVLSSWMNKFEYHFVRVGSVLNEPDKPEWPLKWFLETAKEVKAEFVDVEKIFLILARYAREYFDKHRWALIADPNEDVFSLYLSKYLEFARLVKEQMGEKAMIEYMRGFEIDSDSTEHGWSLLHEWIRHDRRYFEKVLDGVKDPFAPSKIDPTVNELTQTLIDMLSACRIRLEPLWAMLRSRKEFVSECCDHVVRAYVVHAVRIKIASDELIENKQLIVSSLQKLIEMGTGNDLVSPQLRKLLSELINDLE